jgi:hypothetical protein
MPKAKTLYIVIADAWHAREDMAFVATRTAIRKTESMPRAEAEKRCAEMNARDLPEHFYRRAIAALQFLEELGGSDARQYVDIMRRLSQACADRADTCESAHGIDKQ